MIKELDLSRILVAMMYMHDSTTECELLDIIHATRCRLPDLDEFLKEELSQKEAQRTRNCTVAPGLPASARLKHVDQV